MENSSQPPDALLAEAAESLFRLGRLFSKMGVLSSGTRRSARVVDLSRILVVQAVESIQAQSNQDATVGMIAQQLAVEPSTASRLVADTIKDGYVSRSVSLIDSRRVQLELTEAGRLLGQDARAYQTDIFRQVTHDWTEAERSEFARLFVQFTAAVADTLRSQTDSD